MLAAGIVAGLVSRGDFAGGPFEQLFKSIGTGAEAIETNPEALKGLICAAMMALMTAETAIELNDANPSPPSGEGWKDSG